MFGRVASILLDRCELQRRAIRGLVTRRVLLASVALVGCAQQSVVQNAVLLARQGEEKRAIALLEGYLQEHSGATRERRLLLRLHAEVGDMPAAERDAAALARSLGEGSAVPWIELGHALELQHRYDEALQMYDRAATVALRDPTGPRVGGLRAAHWGEFDLAAERLTEALRRDARDAEAWHALGVVELQRGQLAAARHAYESGLVAAPNSAENRLGLATVALKQGAYATALQHYDKLVQLRPRYAPAHLGRSAMLILLGRGEEASQALAQAEALGADPRVVQAQRKALRRGVGNSSTNTQKP